MSSAGKWILGLLLLVLGAVFVARTVSSDPASNATPKVLPSAETVAKTEKTKAPPAPATDVACKKACIEVNEVANDSVTTAKLAPGSVTLSKLAFEVPNLNELENEINARKAAEAASKAAAAEARVALGEAAAATAKNDAAITAAAQNGLVAEAAARNAAVDDITKKFTAGDADLLGRLNKEIADRGAGDDVLQLKLNTEIADRAGAINTLRGELGNPNQVAAPIVKINNNEIVGDAVTSDKLLDGTIQTQDLANSLVVNSKLGADAITTDKVKDGEVKTSDIADQNVTTAKIADQNVTNQKLGGDSVTSNKIKDGEVQTDDIADGAVTLPKLAANSVDSSKVVANSLIDEDLADNSVGAGEIKTGAVGSSEVADNSLTAADLATASVGSDEVADNSLTAADLDTNSVGADEIIAGAVGTSEIANFTVLAEDLHADFLTSLVTETEFSARVTTPVPGAPVLAGEPAPNNAAAGTDPGSTIEWSRLNNVPNGFEDNVDDDGTTGLNSFKNELKNAGTPDTTIDEGDDDVSWFKLRDVPLGFKDGTDAIDGGTAIDLNCTGCLTADDLANDSVEGAEIKNGTITAADLAGSDTDTDPGTAGDQLIAGAVTSEKILDDTIHSRDILLNTITADDLAPDSVTSSEIANGTIETADLKAGAVTADKIKAHVQSGSNPAGASIVTIVANTGVQGEAVSAPFTPDGDNHTLLVLGQVQLSCSGTGCGTSPGNTITLKWQLFDGATALSQEYSAIIRATDPLAVATVSHVIHDSGPASLRTYSLKVTSSSGTDAATTVVPTNGTLNVVDLGRKP